MGITFINMRVINPESKKSKEFEFLVDSGAVYSVLPGTELKKLGIKPTSYEQFTLANGEIIKKQVGNAYYDFNGKQRAAPVIFGDKDIFLMGATTLEALGLILDPVNRKLKPLPMLMM